MADLNFNVSDADFLNTPPPVVEKDTPAEELAAQAAAAEADAAAQQAQADKEAQEAQAAADAQAAQKAADDAAAAEAARVAAEKATAIPQQVEKPVTIVAEEEDEAAKAAKAALAAKGQADLPAGEQTGTPAVAKTDEVKPPATGTEQAQATVNFEEGYKKIMAPFKANGKEIQLKDPEEAIRLMQMGADYTRKMQQLQPQRKMLMMLQNAGLLDEAKLGFLIDLDRKDPEAIKKFIKDSGVDPLSIDTSVEPTYQPGNHTVNDKDVLLHTTIQDLRGTEEGQKTIDIVHTTWDDASKQELGKQPELLSVFHQQRENGLYDLITTEMERMTTMGQIPVGTPFLAAYKAVGDKLVAEQVAKQAASTQSAPVQQAQPVATRVAAPKQDASSEKVKAAASTPSAPKKAAAPVNFLAMSDEEFLKAQATINR